MLRQVIIRINVKTKFSFRISMYFLNTKSKLNRLKNFNETTIYYVFNIERKVLY